MISGKFSKFSYVVSTSNWDHSVVNYFHQPKKTDDHGYDIGKHIGFIEFNCNPTPDEIIKKFKETYPEELL